jgi:hypothetical protein
MSKRSRPVVDYVESDSDETGGDDEEPWDPSDESESESDSEDDESDDLSGDESDSQDLDSDSDLVEEEFESEADRIRDQLMNAQGYSYTKFETLDRADVLRALRFVRNMGENHHCISTPVATRLGRKLTVKYNLKKLKHIGGVPRAFKRKDTVCTLFALLLEHVFLEKWKHDREKLISSLPGGLGDALSHEQYSANRRNGDIDATPEKKCELIWNEISNDMEALDAERYIKRCVGGAVAFLVKYPEKIDPTLHEYFEVSRGMENSDGRRKFRILGASTRAPLDENKNRLVIPIYSKVADEKPCYICAHVSTDLVMKDLLETCKHEYQDVMEELGHRTFTLVFSSYRSKFGHSPDYTPILRFVAVPPDYTLPPQTRDSRGMICAIENPTPRQIEVKNPYDGKVNRFEIVVRDAGESAAMAMQVSQYASHLKRQDGLKIAGYIPGFTKKNYTIYRPTSKKVTDKVLEQRKKTLKLKLEKCVQWISQSSEKMKTRFGKTLPWPGSIKAQEFVHASIEARIVLHPYDDATQILN